jgi:tetratricopeptide (TPR) repeat protein
VTGDEAHCFVGGQVMERIEKTVYISYRYTNAYHALAVYQSLLPYGYDCFIDQRDINTEAFTAFTLNQIKARAHFVVLLTPSALANCTDPYSHFRQEIEAALDYERNIVPLMFLGFNYKSPSIARYLTGKLVGLNAFQTQLIPEGLCDLAMARVDKRFLGEAVDVQKHDIPQNEHVILSRKQTIASHQPAVSTRHLIIEQVFERATRHVEQGRFEQAVIDYGEALRLKPTYIQAYHYRGIAHRDRGDPKRAIADLTEAINLGPNYASAYHDRGLVYVQQKNYHSAIADFKNALSIDPDFIAAQENLELAEAQRRQGGAA